MKIFSKVALVCGLAGMLIAGCGGSGTEAEKRGIGATCTPPPNGNCVEGLSCLAFKGGYCGLIGCTNDAGCPAGSACVQHNTANYCFLVCNDKPDCNRNRTLDNEANCVANAVLVEPGKSTKVCVPPSRS